MCTEIDYGEVAETWDDEDHSSEIQVETKVSRRGHRDFRLVRTESDGNVRAVDPLDLLGLDRAAELIELDKECDKHQAMALALCRLLVPNIQKRRSGRHLVVDAWTEAAARGETLCEEVRIPVSSELARDQREEWNVIQANENPPEGSLEELFWSAVTELPHLDHEFRDPKLWRFAWELYVHLVPEGEGLVKLDLPSVSRKIDQYRENDFAQLGLDLTGRELQRLFRKMIAVTLRRTSKLTGRVALDVIREKYDGTVALNPTEELLLNLRYGSTEQFGWINAGYLTGCGQLFSAFFNDIFEAVAKGASLQAQTRATNNLFKFVYLFNRYQGLRKYAWQEEALERPGRASAKLPGKRKQPLFDTEIVDKKARTPLQQAVVSEEMRVLVDGILPELENSKRQYANFTRLFIENDCDFESAAAESGLSLRQYKRRMKETVLPAVQRLEKRMRNAEND